jgi:hypothetical protein
MLTPKELGIEPWEFRHLIKVRDYLRTRKPPLVEDPQDGDLDDEEICEQKLYLEGRQTRFNMAVQAAFFDCGTAFCIGGLVKLSQLTGGELPEEGVRLSLPRQKAIVDYVESKRSRWRPLWLGTDIPIEDLYYPDDLDEEDWAKVLPEQAAQAIDNFLNTGKSKWAEVVTASELCPTA